MLHDPRVSTRSSERFSDPDTAYRTHTRAHIETGTTGGHRVGAPVFAALALIVAACSESPPTAVDTTCPPTATCGRIADLQTAFDIMAFNMNAQGGASFRRLGVITRWELPVPVHLSPDLDIADRESAIAALDYWQAAVGIAYELVDAAAFPRLLIRPGTDGLAPQGGGRALIDATFASNRARSGLVVFEPSGGQYCTNSVVACRYLFRHEIGHALGFIGHSTDGLMFAGPDTLTVRERAMISTLYSLPHGAIVASDGSWSMIPQ